jgi:hypothetical protein
MVELILYFVSAMLEINLSGTLIYVHDVFIIGRKRWPMPADSSNLTFQYVREKMMILSKLIYAKSFLRNSGL